MSYPGITFRPISSEDEPLLREIYRSTRLEEMAPLGWDPQEVDAFLKMQFEAQHKYYLEAFADASFELILLDQQPIGRLYLDRRNSELRIIDIALLPSHRNRGIGSALMKDILAEAQSVGKQIRIHVERNNPALRLYQRLGFEEKEDAGVYYLMEWNPSP